MKRFYEKVTGGPDFSILLDGKPVKSQKGALLVCPNGIVCDHVQKEWDAQEDIIVPFTMPMMQIISTVVDLDAQEREDLQRRVLGYLDTDLLCYRAEDPETLAARQCSAWDPWCKWFADRYGVELETTTGLMALSQDEKAHQSIKQQVLSLDDHRFTVLQVVTHITGSIILALAFLEGAADAATIFKACHVEEDFKGEIYDEEKYGAAPQQEKKDREMRADLKAARILLDSL